MSADQDFKQLIRKFYGYLKAFHHLQTLQKGEEQGTPPIFLSQLADRLYSSIHPARPNQTTDWWIYGNARNWLHTEVDILKDHYKDTLDTIKQEILNSSLVRWEEAWRIATKWTKRNVKSIQDNTITRASLTITRLLTDETTSDQEPGPSSEINPRRTRTLSNQPTRQTPQEPDRPSQTLRTEKEIGTNKIPPTKEKNPKQKNTPPQLPSLTNNRNDPAEDHNIPQKPTNLNPDTLQLMNPAQIKDASTNAKNIPALNKTAQEHMSKTPTKQINPDSLPDLGSSSMLSSTNPDLYQLSPELSAETPKTRQKTTLTPPPKKKRRLFPTNETIQLYTPNTSTVSSFNPSENSDSIRTVEPRADPQTEIQPLTHSINQRQEHGGDKYKNWTLKPTRPILIIGDSNLCHLPKLENKDLQIVSYPGAQLEHAFHIIRNKTPVSAQVQHIILSFGLNNRERVNRSHLGKMIQRLIGASSSTFPFAIIHIPLINYDRSLPEKFIDNLTFINEAIQSTGLSIPLLPTESFRTQVDKIHWTPTTGRAMANHWLKHLN